MSPFLDLLKQISEGVTIFEPFRRTPQEIDEFQNVVHRLQEMERLGLVNKLFKQTKSTHGKEYVDLVMILGGGLTAEGVRILSAHTSNP